MKKFLKQNKTLLFLPLLLMPFVVLIFYILGGGEGTGVHAGNTTATSLQGANYSIPEAESSIAIQDKLEAYQQQRERASTRDYRILEELDSTHRPGQSLFLPEDSVEEIPDGLEETGLNADISSNLLAHIRQKEEEINRELNPSNNPRLSKINPVKESREKPIEREYQSGLNNNQKDTDRNQQQPSLILQKTGIEELDNVFDENLILTAQNDSLRFQMQQINTRLQELEKKETSGFTLEKQSFSGFGKEQPETSLIKAEIYETTTVLDGNRVKLRLLEDTWLDGKKIARNSFIYGICKINNERLHISITRFPVEEDFVPVDLAIHDLDGLPGLYVPGNAARKVSQEVGSSTNTSSLFGFTNDPLTYAGVRAADRTAQTLLKRVRLKKVTVKKNTLVYLVNNNQKQK
jgi:conjugative transposon TraM protein